jgi:UPF0716 protein FxsA
VTAGATGARRRRRPGSWALAGLLALPVVELAVAIAVGRRIGALPTILLLLLGSAGGLVLLRHEGASALRRIRGRPGTVIGATGPGGGGTGGRTAPDLALVLLAGILLLVPGFVTDVVGLLLLLPPVRRVVGGLAGVAAMRRLGPLVGPGRVIRGEIDGEDGPADDSSADDRSSE